MKNRLSLMLLMLCLCGIAVAQNDDKPGWLTNLPKAGNSTYVYVMERGNGPTYNEAINNAMLKVIRNTCLRIGVAIDANEVNKALQQNTDWTILADQKAIPINKVCEYRERKDDKGIIVAVLCQVAQSGNVYPKFDEFRACNDNKVYSDGSALVKSIFIPGLGQMGKRNYGSGVFTLLGEVVFIGGAVGSYYMANQQLDIMKNFETSFDDFKAAKRDYYTWRTVNIASLSAAAALYAWNLYRAYTITPKYKKSKNKTAFYPTLLPLGDEVSAGMGLTLNF